MARSKAHEPEKLTRYALGDLEGEERESLERHLESCASCREFLSFVQDFNSGLREAKPQERLPGELCPDPALLAALQDGELDDETAQHVRVHMLYCENCREDYQALEKSRPKIIDVVLGIAGSLIEVVRPPETGVWESHLAMATVKGETVLSAPFRVTELLADEDRNESKVTVQVDASIEPDHIRVLAEGETVQPVWRWRISLLDGQEEEWVGMPLDKAKILVTSGIPLGLYTLTVKKGDRNLGAFKFTVENMSPDEAFETAGEYIGNGDYFRASAILKDALRRDPGNERLLQKLNEAEDLAAQEEAEAEGESDLEGEPD